ncbi:MAG: sensor histidine kinase N-terminal domain-containing protein [Burkholderiales bacterium]|nr:sensor histidine kinase N-terminal domain-containing protein [Burkholderiales bacterium]
MTREQPRLRSQLLTWLLVPLALLLIADAFVSYWIALEFSRRAYDRSLIEIAHEISLHLRGPAEALELDLPEAARRVLLTDPSDRIYFGVSSADGRAIAGVAVPAPSGKIVHGPHAEALYDAVIGNAPVRVVEYRPDLDGRSRQRAVVVRVAETEVKRRDLAREILLSVVAPQVLLVLLAGLIVWAGVAHGLSPLERLRKAVASRKPYDRSPVEVTDIPAEVRPLLQSINGLLGRLDRVLTAQSRFVADAAHQLKTPVAGLQAQLELALRQQDTAQMRASIGMLQKGLDRLARLVSQLLSLARNEPAAAISVRLAPIDLNALALEAASSWVPEALAKSIDLGFEGASAPVMIEGDAERLRELMDNLLDNAVRYTAPGGRVTLTVSATPLPSMSVNDDGPSIPSEERARVFERFHRLLGTRYDGGSGLGLAIAQEIARIHGTSIALADDSDGIGNAFSVTFPFPGKTEARDLDSM